MSNHKIISSIPPTFIIILLLGIFKTGQSDNNSQYQNQKWFLSDLKRELAIPQKFKDFFNKRIYLDNHYSPKSQTFPKPSNKPTVSIIIDVFSHPDGSKKFYDVKKALLSIQKQEKGDLEIIIVDTNSTENSKKILKEEAKKDERIQLIHLPIAKRQGILEARLEGVKKSKGNWILFLDQSAAFATKNSLHELLKFATNSQANIIHFQSLEGNIDKGNLRLCTSAYNEKTGNEIYMDKRLSDHMKKIPYIIAWDKLYRRKAFDTPLEIFKKYKKEEKERADDSILIQILIKKEKYQAYPNVVIHNNYFYDSPPKDKALYKQRALYYYNNALIAYFNHIELDKYDEDFFGYNLKHFFKYAEDEHLCETLAKKHYKQINQMCYNFNSEPAIKGDLGNKFNTFCDKIKKLKVKLNEKKKDKK